MHLNVRVSVMMCILCAIIEIIVYLYSIHSYICTCIINRSKVYTIMDAQDIIHV